MHFSYSVSFISVGPGTAKISPLVNISLSTMVPHREVQALPSEVLSDPTPHCQKFWHHLLVFHSLLCIFFLLLFSFFFICFPLSLLLLLLLSLVPQVFSYSFLYFHCLTGSFFDFITVSLWFSFSICFPSNQHVSCLKTQWSSVCPVGYLPYCDKNNELFSAFPTDLKCCYPSTRRWFHIFRMSGSRMILNKQYLTEKCQWAYSYSQWRPCSWLAVSANRRSNID